MKIIAEFAGGGVNPYNRVEVIRLTRVMDFNGYIVSLCEVLFRVATFYYLLNAIVSIKSLGFSEYFKDSWNVIDVFTIAFSLLVIGLYVTKVFSKLCALNFKHFDPSFLWLWL